MNKYEVKQSSIADHILTLVFPTIYCLRFSEPNQNYKRTHYAIYKIDGNKYPKVYMKFQCLIPLD